MSVSTPTSLPFASQPEEVELLRRLKAGEEDAFERLVRGFGPSMLSVARKFLHHERDSQDAVQEAFLSSFRALSKFNGDSRLWTWLYRILVNSCLMKLRSRRRKPEIAIDDLLPRYANDGHRESIPVQKTVQDTTVAEHEIREQVRAAIDQLPDNYREILLLRDIAEMSTEETAIQLEIGEGAVKTRLHRARLALRELLIPYMQGEGP